MDYFDVEFVAFDIKNPTNNPTSSEKQTSAEIAMTTMLHELEVR